MTSSFFEIIFGHHLRCSCGHWENSEDSLHQAEENILSLTMKRAQIHNGDKILERGCGRGFLSLFLAKKCPASKITSVTNSETQKRNIE